jgi:uncharacterized coiled-coil protein SlyX
MNKRQKLQLSNEVICWLSKEVTQVRHIIERLKETSHIKDYMVGEYSIEDLDYLEEKIKELECRSAFESRNIRKIRYED